MFVRVLVISVLLMLQGCSGKDQDDAGAAAGEQQHVWKEQVETIDKAGRLEQDINAAFKRRAEEVDAR